MSDSVVVVVSMFVVALRLIVTRLCEAGGGGGGFVFENRNLCVYMNIKSETHQQNS